MWGMSFLVVLQQFTDSNFEMVCQISMKFGMDSIFHTRSHLLVQTYLPDGASIIRTVNHFETVQSC